MNKSRVTERQNENTKWVDIIRIEEIIRAFRSVDSQIFRGYQHYECVYEERIINSMVSVSKRISSIISGEKKGLVILSGCGTSGRLGWFACRNFNRILGRRVFDYTMAGRGKALIISQEGSEDFPRLGKEDLKKLIESYENLEEVVYIGITCGLSALYVGGQLDFFLEHQKVENPKYRLTGVLMGFNPLEQARDSLIPYWEQKTFRNVVKELTKLSSPDFFFLNPVLGPEAIQGSSRMKGGSATKILLDVLFSLAYQDCNSNVSPNASVASEMINKYERTYVETYQEIFPIKDCCFSCGESLKKGGNVYYLGVDVCGIFGLIDASECLPTFGANFEDIRGFLYKGWDDMDSHENSEEMKKHGNTFHLSIKNFLKNYYPGLNEKDTVVFLGMESHIDCSVLKETFEMMREKKCQKFAVWITTSEKKKEVGSFFKKELGNSCVCIKLTNLEVIPKLYSFGGFSMKLMVNAISTIAHILKGTIYTNIMINVRLANTKLVQRGINIVRNILNVEEEPARKGVMRAIYDDGDYSKMGMNDHVKVATPKQSIIPVAVLLVSGKCETVKDARILLKGEPILRNLIHSLISGK